MSNKRGLAVVYAGVVATLVAYAATYARFHPQPPAAAKPLDAVPPASREVVARSGATVADIAANAVNSLSWPCLTAAQRGALAPLAPEWHRFSDARKRKWLKIASRYPKMKPQEQERLHQRMAEWVHMTPEQRRVARENYQLSKELSAQTRKRAWTAYQQLPDELKRKLATAEKSRRPTVVSAPPSGRRGIRDLGKLESARERANTQTAASAGAAAAVPEASSAAGAPPASVSTTVPAPASAVSLRTEPAKPVQSVPWFFNDHAH